MARFQPADAFHSSGAIQLLPFRFERTRANSYLVSNFVGDFVSLTADEFERLVDERVTPGDGLYEKVYPSI